MKFSLEEKNHTYNVLNIYIYIYVSKKFINLLILQ